MKPTTYKVGWSGLGLVSVPKLLFSPLVVARSHVVDDHVENPENSGMVGKMRYKSLIWPIWEERVRRQSTPLPNILQPIRALTEQGPTVLQHIWKRLDWTGCPRSPCRPHLRLVQKKIMKHRYRKMGDSNAQASSQYNLTAQLLCCRSTSMLKNPGQIEHIQHSRQEEPTVSTRRIDFFYRRLLCNQNLS